MKGVAVNSLIWQMGHLWDESTKFIVKSFYIINLSYLADEIFQCLIMVGGGGQIHFDTV